MMKGVPLYAISYNMSIRFHQSDRPDSLKERGGEVIWFENVLALTPLALLWKQIPSPWKKAHLIQSQKPLSSVSYSIIYLRSNSTPGANTQNCHK